MMVAAPPVARRPLPVRVRVAPELMVRACEPANLIVGTEIEPVAKLPVTSLFRPELSVVEEVAVPLSTP